MNKSLPSVKKGARIEFKHFPTAQQAFIFRNWEMFPSEHLAKVIGATKSQVEELAELMGLPPQKANGDWRSKGYITIIRQNWHLLPYDQLIELLEWDEDYLAYILKEDDFLSHKLGNLKPDVPRIKYRPLTESEKEETHWLREQIKELSKLQEAPETVKPFSFMFKGPQPVINHNRPFENAVVIDEDWGIYANDKSSIAALHIKDFIEDYKFVTGIKIANGAKGKNIILNCNNNFSDPESHLIKINKSEIIIEAGGHEGLYQGLIWLVKKAQENGGAFYRPETVNRDRKVELRIAYSYCAVYGDYTEELLDSSYPDSLLKSYAYSGVNGIWLQGILYKLTEFPFDKSLSEGWEKRVAALNTLIKRAERYGIKIFLYINEPRSMPEDFFIKYPHLKGESEHSFWTMCTSTPEVQKYLKEGIAELTRNLTGLGGYITITMSENLTNCFSRTPADKVTCPRCKNRKPYEVVAEVNSLITEGAMSVNPDIEVIAWTWAWGDMDFVRNAVSLMPRKVRIMGVSEEGVKREFDGVETYVRDYSISIVGPGKKYLGTMEAAREFGHPTAAKVQFNNTWECSAVPYIPVFDLIAEHRNGLKDTSAFLLDWTLGGYPSVIFNMLSDSYFSDTGFSLKDAVCRVFGGKAASVMESQRLFSKAFKEFPFYISTLYVAPQNYGPANLFYPDKTGFRATMIGYPYDDVEGWRSIFPVEIFVNQWEKLCEGWEEGLRLLEETDEDDEYAAYCRIAKACYCHFKSTYNALRFTLLRDKRGAASEILEILYDELSITEMLYKITLEDPHIGYEASNHYYYSRNTLLEKIINVQWLIKKYSSVYE